MVVIKGEGRVQILYGRHALPSPPHRPVYLARPNAVDRHPGVVMLHGDGGVTPSVRDLCRRLARHGFAAAAPDLFRGAAADDLSSVSEARAVRDGVEVADAFLDAWSGFIAPVRPAALALGESARIGATVAAAVGGPLVVVGGPLVGLADGLAAVRGPTLGLVGGADGGSEAARLLHGRVGRGEWVVFPGAGPGFYDDGSDDFDLGAFEGAIERVVAFLDRHLAPVSR